MNFWKEKNCLESPVWQKRLQLLNKVQAVKNKTKSLFLQASFLSLILSLALPASPLLAEGEQYFLNNKVVSKEQYQAAILLQEGVKSLHANNNRDAVTKLKQAADLYPGFAEVHHNLGIALAKTGQVKEAISELELARNLNPNLDSTWMSLGGLYQTEGRIQDAISTYSEFVKRFPAHKDAKKVSELILGLQKEASSENNVQQGGNLEDYYAEVTAHGRARWPSSKMPLKVFIAQGKNVPNFKTGSEDLLKQSFMDWQNASQGAVSFEFVDSEKNSDIQCTWTDDSSKFKNAAEAGETQLFSGKTGLVKGTIAFLTVPLMPDMPLTQNRLRLIFLHEIGHVIGMAGHTNNPKDAMFFSIDVADNWRDLTPRDAATAIRLYSEP